MTVRTGTPDTFTEHSPPAAWFNVILAVVAPFAVIIAGIVMYGWAAIAWGAAILWGMIASAIMLATIRVSRASGMTRLEFTDLMGSMFAPPGTPKSRAYGTAIHLVNGALLGVAFAYAVQMVGWSASWASGLTWGIVLWALATIVLATSIGALHPAIRRGEEPDPGFAARKLGIVTPVASLLGHAVYGLILGSLYSVAPF